MEMQLFIHTVLLSVLCWLQQQALADIPPVITIGAVLSSEEHGESFEKAVNAVNTNSELLPDGVVFKGAYILMNDNPILAARDVCEKTIPKEVYVVVASHPPNSKLSPVAISFTCGFYQIPVIGISARESSFSDKNIHGSFMRTVAPYSHQTKVWVEMLNKFEFKKVIFIHSSDAEGRAMLGRFQSAAEDENIEIEKTLQYVPGEMSYRDFLQEIPELQPRIILLYADETNAEIIYRDAQEFNITGDGYAWIVTEQALKPKNTPNGFLGLQQKYIAMDEDEDRHIDDTIHVIAKAFRQLQRDNENITAAPGSCSDVASSWDDSGPKVLEYLKQQSLENGETGRLTFDEAGDRANVEYEVKNVHRRGLHEEVYLNTVGNYTDVDDKGLQIPEKNGIVWPGGGLKKPVGLKINKNLKVVTIEELPFIYTDKMKSSGENCEESEGRMPCPKTHPVTGEIEHFCCYGYAIKLLIELKKEVNFTCDLHLVSDGKYGSFDFQNGSKSRQWDGMVGDLIHKNADLIVAPLTINPERADVIAFSKPFKYQGLTVLVKKTLKDSSLASFLQPFQDTLWILVALSVHVVALVLYLLDRFSPFGRYKLAKSDDTEEDALNLSGAVWFAWGVLLNSGIGEGTPRSFSARVLGMVWAGFAMIIVASYTANLAAFLVLDRPEASISGIDDARLRNPQDSFLFATVKNSAVSMYFKRQVELSTMYRTMEDRNYDTAEEAIAHVRSGELHAFIWDSSRLEFESANDCDLVTAGEFFGRSGYGIGLRKDSPWINEISMKILDFHERGFMEKLDSEWILIQDAQCPNNDPSAATLGLTNMAGVFMMVAGGIVMGVFLIFVEIAYKRHRGLKEKELELAKTAADRWRGNIEKKKVLQDSWAYLRKYKNFYRDPEHETTHPSPNLAAATDGAWHPHQWRQSRENGGDFCA